MTYPIAEPQANLDWIKVPDKFQTNKNHKKNVSKLWKIVCLRVNEDKWLKFINDCNYHQKLLRRKKMIPRMKILKALSLPFETFEVCKNQLHNKIISTRINKMDNQSIQNESQRASRRRIVKTTTNIKLWKMNTWNTTWRKKTSFTIVTKIKFKNAKWYETVQKFQKASNIAQ